MRIRAAHLLRASLALFSLRSVACAEAPVALPRLCYTGENQLSPSYVLPCFTRPEDDGEVHSCCLAGDYCLTNQACYNVKRGIKYQKGCTDKGYNHYNCPKKCGTDQTKADWVGLIHCNGSNGTPDNAWVCQHPDNCYAPASNCPGTWSPELEITRETYCEDIQHDKRWVAIERQSVLASTASLPAYARVQTWWSSHPNWLEHTSFFAQTDPFASTRPTESPLEASRTSNAGVTTPTFSGNATVGSPQERNPSGGQKVGMAVGLGVGIPMVVAGIGFFVYFLRRRRNDAGTEQQPHVGPGATLGDGCLDEKSKDSKSEAYGFHGKAELPGESTEMKGDGISQDSAQGKVGGDGVYELAG